jgi:hypothetical protein
VKRAIPLLAAMGAVAVVLLAYLALGGGAYEPTPVADPCASRELPQPDDLQTTLELVVLSAVDGAACDLGVSREDLVLALRDEESLDAFATEHGISRADAERAVEEGVDRALQDAEQAGAFSGFGGSLVRRTLERAPAWLLLDVLEGLQLLVP